MTIWAYWINLKWFAVWRYLENNFHIWVIDPNISNCWWRCRTLNENFRIKCIIFYQAKIICRNNFLVKIYSIIIICRTLPIGANLQLILTSVPILKQIIKSASRRRSWATASSSIPCAIRNSTVVTVHISIAILFVVYIWI